MALWPVAGIENNLNLSLLGMSVSSPRPGYHWPFSSAGYVRFHEAEEFLSAATPLRYNLLSPLAFSATSSARSQGRAS